MIGTEGDACPVLLWTEGTLFPLFDSLDDFLGELEGKVANPIDTLTNAIATAAKRRDAGDREGAAELLEAALSPFAKSESCRPFPPSPSS